MASGGGRDKGRRVHSACAPVSLVAVPGLRVGVPVGRAWPSGACPASPARAAALRPCQFPPMGRGTASSRTRACVTALIAFLYSGRAQPQKPIVASLPCAASLAPRRVCGPLLRGGGNDTGAARLGSEAASSTTLALRRRLGILRCRTHRWRTHGARGVARPVAPAHQCVTGEGGQHGLRERGSSRTSGTIRSRRAGRSGLAKGAVGECKRGCAPDELTPSRACLWPVAGEGRRRGTLTSWRALHRQACARLRTPPRKATPAPLTGEGSGRTFEEGGGKPTDTPPERGQRERVRQAPRIGQAQNGKAKPQASRDARWERGVLSAQGASNERLLEPRGEG
ncbi:hypothetical protein ERJ75_000887400 [Trypanosoma vivax]|nr:hypothetical protein ERJ75_000887400 [Trypanosoma vivax]